MDSEFTSLSSNELVNLYHKINTDLRKRFLDRAPWGEKQERINILSEISKELTKRKIELTKEGLPATSHHGKDY